MIPEFSRPLVLDRLGEPETVRVEADPQECAAVAARLKIPRVRALSCQFTLARDGEGRVRATGHLRADLDQVCVVSLESFSASVDEMFRVVFVPAGRESDALDVEADDEIGYAGSAIDLGEAAVEQLALSLDPFPRKPDARLEAPGSGARDNPFEALARFRPARKEK